MQADRKSEVSVGVRAHSNLPSNCVDDEHDRHQQPIQVEEPDDAPGQIAGCGRCGRRDGRHARRAAKNRRDFSTFAALEQRLSSQPRAALARLAEIAENARFAHGGRRAETTLFGRRAKSAGPLWAAGDFLQLNEGFDESARVSGQGSVSQLRHPRTGGACRRQRGGGRLGRPVSGRPGLGGESAGACRRAWQGGGSQGRARYRCRACGRHRHARAALADQANRPRRVAGRAGVRRIRVARSTGRSTFP